MSRLSIRLRLTLVFGCAMAIVLVAVGAFLYFRLASELDRAIDEGLRSRAADIAGLLQSTGSGLDGTATIQGVGDDSFTQVLDDQERIVAASQGVGEEPVLTAEQLSSAAASPRLLEVGPVASIDDGPTRLLVIEVPLDGGNAVIVVGTSLEERDEALASLLAQLLVVLPIALLVTSVLGYVVAAAALRPVDAMRRRAATISAEDPGARLPVSGPHDEVARLGETLNEMLARLESALERERRLVADASHELRTPLALLKTELELAQRSSRTREELETAIESAAEETDRLAQLTEDLLLLARSDDNALALRETEISSRALLERVSSRFGDRARRQGREVVVEVGQDVELLGDELRLEQALGNLVDNALRHGAGTITLSATQRGNRVELHVRDEGEGFPRNFVDKAFERFSQADDARSIAGTGLGLSIVDVIARAHGGSAHVDANGAANVWLALPARVA